MLVSEIYINRTSALQIFKIPDLKTYRKLNKIPLLKF